MPHSRARASRSRLFISHEKLPRLILIAFVAGGALWLCISVGVSHFRSLHPMTVLRYAPFDARAKAELAETYIKDLQRDPRAPAKVERLAQAALVRDPTLVSAWRSLALINEIRGDRKTSARLFHLSELLSRRDLPTQLWLIEERVAANDIRGALQHYDIALRTSPRSGNLLLPVLVAATAEDAVIDPLAEMMITNPPWQSDLISKFSAGAPSADNLALLMEKIARARPIPPTVAMSTIVNRLVDEGEFRAAWRIYRLSRRLGKSEDLLRNGGFEAVEAVSVFDWQLENGMDLAAEPILLEGVGQGSALEVRAAAGLGGTAARQLLLLPPGNYQLSAEIGPVEGATPAQLNWTVSCARNSSILAENKPHPARTRGAMRLDVKIPAAGCPAQWLALGVRPEYETDRVAAWVDSARITQAGASHSDAP